MRPSEDIGLLHGHGLGRACVRARARARATLTAAAVSVHGTRDCGSARQGRPRRAARCSMRPQETGCSDVCVVAAYRTSLNFKTAASIGKKVDHLGDHSRLEWLRYRNHPVSQEVSQHAAEIISCKQPRHRSGGATNAACCKLNHARQRRQWDTRAQQTVAPHHGRPPVPRRPRHERADGAVERSTRRCIDWRCRAVELSLPSAIWTSTPKQQKEVCAARLALTKQILC
jgi:hypothetical protein